jgi:hypothetical protein
VAQYFRSLEKFTQFKKQNCPISFSGGSTVSRGEFEYFCRGFQGGDAFIENVALADIQSRFPFLPRMTALPVHFPAA